MLSLELINKRLRDYEQDPLRDIDTRMDKIDILYWVKQNYIEENIKNKIQRLEEELLGLNPTDIKYTKTKAKIHELEFLIK